MGFLDTYKVKKALAVLLTAQNPRSPQAVQAITRLREIGKPDLTKFIEAFSSAHNAEVIEELLVAFLDNDTFSFFAGQLTHANPQIASGMVQVFVKGTKYDPNRFVPLLTDTKTSKAIIAAIGKVLTQRKDHVNCKPLMAVLGTADRDNRPIFLRLIERSATEATLPDLIRATRSDDPTIRLHMVRILMRFGTEAVRDTFAGLLNDPYKEVRQAALDGLARLASIKVPMDTAALSQMLRDPDPMLQVKAKEILIQAHDPQTVHHLVDLLQDDEADVRQRAVEVLNALHDTTPIRMLIESLRGREWWVKVRTFDALCAGGETTLFTALVALLQDTDAYIRQSAEEILKKDQRAFDHLAQSLSQADAAQRNQILHALVLMGDRRAVPVFLEMMQAVPEMGPMLIPALARLGDRQALPALMACAQGTEKPLRIAALRAMSSLTDATHAEQVWKVVMAVRESADDAEVKEAANATANALVSKGVLVRPVNTIMMQAPSPTREPSPLAGVTLFTPHTATAEDVVVVQDANDDDGAVNVESLEPNTVLIKRYRVIRRVGKGGFGAVILVEDTEVGEDIILKFLHREVAADDGMIERFKHELRYARKITHENVIRIHELLTIQKSYAISMEYFPSHSLAEELKQQGPVNLKRGLKIVWDICRGMSAAHQVGVVHRDLKPPNILINDSGLVKVVDFGLAAVNHGDARLTKTGVLLGTPTYMAPEQVRARTIDARTDIYSLGVIMYEMFTGRPPYVADDPMAILFQHVEGNPKPPREVNAEIPSGVEAIILKAMWVDPAQRFQTMDDLRRSIYALSKQEGR
jgi:serine/threonine-protein kinase